MQQFGRRVTDANHSYLCVMGQCLCDQPCGICEIDEPGVGGNCLDNFRLSQNRWQGTQSHGCTTRAGSFLARKAVLHCDSFVTCTRRDSTYANAVQDKMRAL